MAGLGLASGLVLLLPVRLGLPTLGVIVLAAAGVGLITLTEAGAVARGLRLAWVVAAGATGVGVLWHHASGAGSLPLFVGVGVAALSAVTLAEGWRQHNRGRMRWTQLALPVLVLLGLGLLIVRAQAHGGLMTLVVFLGLSLGGFGLSLVTRSLIDRLGAWFL